MALETPSQEIHRLGTEEKMI